MGEKMKKITVVNPYNDEHIKMLKNYEQEKIYVCAQHACNADHASTNAAGV